MDWYPRYPTRFDEGTLGFSLAERGAYSGLIDIYYSTAQTLPDDDSKLAALLRVTMAEWRAVSKKVRAKFKKTGGRLFHEKCDAELRKQARFSANSRKNGKNGGRPKRYKEPKHNPSITQQVTPRGATPNPEITTDRDRQTETDRHKNPSEAAVHKSGTNGHNGYANGHGLGSIIKSSVRHASRASQRKLGADEILELWAQKMFRFMQAHYSGSDAIDAWTAWNSGEEKLRDQARAVFDLASKDYDARKLAGTLQPMDLG